LRLSEAKGMVINMKGKVVVLGSFVADLMGRAPHLPAHGETVKGSVFKIGPGVRGQIRP